MYVTRDMNNVDRDGEDENDEGSDHLAKITEGFVAVVMCMVHGPNIHVVFKYSKKGNSRESRMCAVAGYAQTFHGSE